MEINGLENIFDEDLDLTDDNEVVIEQETTDEFEETFFPELQDGEVKEDNILDALLKAKGIENSMITVIDENENEQENHNKRNCSCSYGCSCSGSYLHIA